MESIFYLYHIPGSKIGVTRNIEKRVINAQGYKPGEFEILDHSNDIDYISNKEREMQLLYGYKLDRDSYSKLFKQKLNKAIMKNINVTDQTTTFACPVNKLKGQLSDMVGEQFTTPYGTYSINKELIDWVMSSALPSMFNSQRSFIYNKALANRFSAEAKVDNKAMTTTTSTGNVDLVSTPGGHMRFPFNQENKTTVNVTEEKQPNVYKLIRKWAKERGIYDKGDSKTQYVKLMEEAGELAQALLKNDKVEIKDAIGDMVVVLTNLAKLEGMKLEHCVESAYAEIANRKGSMKNGTFVKNTL